MTYTCSKNCASPAPAEPMTARCQCGGVLTIDTSALLRGKVAKRPAGLMSYRPAKEKS